MMKVEPKDGGGGRWCSAKGQKTMICCLLYSKTSSKGRVGPRQDQQSSRRPGLYLRLNHRTLEYLCLAISLYLSFFSCNISFVEYNVSTNPTRRVLKGATYMMAARQASHTVVYAFSNKLVSTPYSTPRCSGRCQVSGTVRFTFRNRAFLVGRPFSARARNFTRIRTSY